MTSDVRADEVRAGAAAARNQARRGGRAARESQRLSMLGRWALPFLIGALVLVGWEVLVRVNEIPYYIIPDAHADRLEPVERLGHAVRLADGSPCITFAALAVATIGGVGLAILFNQSRLIEFSLFPYAVILQVTPIIAIAPLILIYVKNVQVGLLICAWIVAFFPILSNTTLGLNSADHNLVALFRLYGANRWQTLWQLRLPGAMPYFLGALKISGGLSLIGAVVAEFVAGTGGTGSGLAYRILEASYRLNIPRMFAALFLISLSGIIIFMAFSLLSHLLLRKWHESAIKQEG